VISIPRHSETGGRHQWITERSHDEREDKQRTTKPRS
jgi:hypothetical protein